MGRRPRPGRRRHPARLRQGHRRGRRPFDALLRFASLQLGRSSAPRSSRSCPARRPPTPSLRAQSLTSPVSPPGALRRHPHPRHRRPPRRHRRPARGEGHLPRRRRRTPGGTRHHAGELAGPTAQERTRRTRVEASSRTPAAPGRRAARDRPGEPAQPGRRPDQGAPLLPGRHERHPGHQARPRPRRLHRLGPPVRSTTSTARSSTPCERGPRTAEAAPGDHCPGGSPGGCGIVAHLDGLFLPDRVAMPAPSSPLPATAPEERDPVTEAWTSERACLWPDHRWVSGCGAVRFVGASEGAAPVSGCWGRW